MLLTSKKPGPLSATHCRPGVCPLQPLLSVLGGLVVLYEQSYSLRCSSCGLGALGASGSSPGGLASEGTMLKQLMSP